MRIASITCTGILAHESAKQGGAIVRLPDFTLMPGKTKSAPAGEPALA